MKGIVLGTAGHVDHGKTSLVRALTGIDTDRWAEEKRRGLTIDIGFASLNLDPTTEISVVDVPGHEDFVKNMLVGSTGIDLLLLVVAADEGPMPQTREHLTIARFLGVSHGIVALNKVDRVDEEWLELVRQATREELSAVPGGEEWPIVEVSAVSGTGLDDLRTRIRTAASRLPGRTADDVFRMPVDRSFSVAGAGTVVTGTVWSGAARTGGTVRVLPEDRHARIRSLQVHGGEREIVGPGRRCAMALVGVEAGAVGRGSSVVAGAGWRIARRFGATVAVHAGSPWELEHGQRIRLFLGTGEVMARVLTEDRKAITAGREHWVVLECESSLVARVGDRFILRFYSPVTTIAGGRITEIEPPRRWRRRTDWWEEILSENPATASFAAVRCAAGHGLSDGELAVASGVASESAPEHLGRNPRASRIGERWYDRAVLERTADAILSHLAEAHRSRPRASAESLESVRAALVGRASTEAIDRVLGELAGASRVVVSGPAIHLPSHRPALTATEERALQEIRSLLDESGLEPPAPADVAARLGVQREVFQDLLRLLVERGHAVAITPEIYLPADSLERARETVRQVVSTGEAASPGDFRAELGLTRKYLIPLLEYMDREGVTRRTPAGRISGET